MAVHIKRNPVTRCGKQTLYLLTYHNYKPFREPLSMFVYAKPKTGIEKEHNRVQLASAEVIRSTRELELNRGDKTGLFKIKAEASVIDYIIDVMKDKETSIGLHSTWKAMLDHLTVYLNGASLKFKDCDDDFLKGFREYLLRCTGLNRSKKLANSSASLYISKIKAALNRAVKEKVIIDNPGKRMDNIRSQEVKIEFLTIEEVRLLEKQDFKNPAYKNAFLFGCLTGLRFSDIQKLKWKELVYWPSEQTWKIHFTQKKTSGVLYHPISGQTMEYLGKRGDDEDNVFKGLSNNAHNNKLLLRWVESAGVKKHITFHCSRHTYAVMMQSLSNDIALVSNLMGHKDIKTTMRYAKFSSAFKNRAVEMYPHIRQNEKFNLTA